MDTLSLPQNLSALPAMAWAWSVAFLPRLFAALLVLIVGIFVARLVGRAVTSLSGSVAHLDTTVRPVLASVCRYAILVLAVIAALGQLGIQTASLLAVLGAAGLAIGLALQGTLTNIAAGVMLLWLRPFRVGDYVELAAGNVAGTIEEMGLFACRMVGFDGVVVFAPNSTLWNVALRNHSKADARLVAYSATFNGHVDVAKTIAGLLAATEATSYAKSEPKPEITIDKFSTSAVVILCRFWTDALAVGPAQRTWPDSVMKHFSASADEDRPLEITRLLPSDADPARLMKPRGEVARAPRIGRTTHIRTAMDG